MYFITPLCSFVISRQIFALSMIAWILGLFLIMPSAFTMSSIFSLATFLMSKFLNAFMMCGHLACTTEYLNPATKMMFDKISKNSLSDFGLCGM